MHPEIERLIELALADGAITDKERAIILRKADSLGLDRDEIELVLEGSLEKIKKQSTQNTNQKYGAVRKCPACGQNLGALASHCECGHELTDIEASRTIKALFDKFESIERETEKIGAMSDSRRIKAIQMRKSAAIRDFPVPNSREELQQLILFIRPKIADTGKIDLNIDDWKVKFAEVIGRARNAYKNDSKMLSEFDKIENTLKTNIYTNSVNNAKRNPVAVIGIITLLVLITIGSLAYIDYKAKLIECETNHDKATVVEKARLEKALATIDKEFNEKKFTAALSHLTQMKWEYEDECKQEESQKYKAVWDEKRNALVALIQQSILDEQIKKKEEEDRLLAAEQAREQAILQAQQQQAQQQQAQQHSPQQQGQQQASKNPANPALEIFGAIFGAALNASKEK